MENRKKMPSNWAIYTAMVLLVLVLATTCLSAGLLARYRVTSQGSDGARVAVFEVEKDGDIFVEDLALSMNPDSKDAHCANITIINKSETSIRCAITVESTENLPLTFYTTSGGNRVSYVDIPVGESTQAVLDLYADWNDNEDSYLYHREIDHVVITVTCDQID